MCILFDFVNIDICLGVGPWISGFTYPQQCVHYLTLSTWTSVWGLNLGFLVIHTRNNMYIIWLCQHSHQFECWTWDLRLYIPNIIWLCQHGYQFGVGPGIYGYTYPQQCVHYLTLSTWTWTSVWWLDLGFLVIHTRYNVYIIWLCQRRHQFGGWTWDFFTVSLYNWWMQLCGKQFLKEFKYDISA